MSKASDRQVKRVAAEERQAERDKRSPKEQLAYLDKILGIGVGAKRERARLEKLIEEKK
jgi:hypothetical protein